MGAIGSIVGSWLAGRVPSSWPFGRLMMAAYACDGIAFVPFMFTHNLTVAITFFGVTNLCVLFEIAQIVSWRMRIVPGELIGRVFGAARLWALLGTVPGAILGGALADRYGARMPIIVAGWGYLALALTVSAIPAVRREHR